jgi:hypothetical protein
MKTSRLVATVFFFASFAAISCPARQSTSRQVAITVTDPTGTRIPHAEVRLVPSPGGKQETDNEGKLALALAPGGYALFVSSPGFASTREHIDVTSPSAQDSAVQTIAVGLRIGATGGPITVYAKDTLVLMADVYHNPVTLTAEQFRALPHSTLKVHNGHSNADEAYAGVALETLLAMVNAPIGKELRKEALTSYLICSGTDGYSILVSLPEADPSFHDGQMLVADTRDGKPLEKAGPFQLIVGGDKHPARWVHNLQSISLQTAR